MVRSGKFSLEIIDATTKKPFKEHFGLDGKTYAEVEPEIEYFLRISSNDPRQVCVTLDVDGKNLGYASALSCGKSVEKGLLSCENGVSEYCALKFNKLVNRNRNVSNKSNEEGEDGMPWTGCIKMKVYELVIKEGYHSAQKSYVSSWSANTDHVLKGLNVTSKKKALNSERGSKTFQESHKGGRKWGPGEKLLSVKLLYCSTVGLISAKVLAPPPPPDISGIHGSLSDIDSNDDDDDDDIKNHSKKPRLK